MLKPTFSLTIGALSSATDNAVAGPQGIEVARDMDVAADSLRMFLMARTDVGLDDEVELQLGHDGENETVFVGSVAALQPAFAGVQVTALGKMQGLLRLHTAAWYDDRSAGAIARDLIDQAGSEAGTVDEGPTLPRFAVDRRQNGFRSSETTGGSPGFRAVRQTGWNDLLSRAWATPPGWMRQAVCWVRRRARLRPARWGRRRI